MGKNIKNSQQSSASKSPQSVIFSNRPQSQCDTSFNISFIFSSNLKSVFDLIIQLNARK